MKNFDLIQKYLNDEMSSVEKAEFQARILSDENLAIELELQRQENLALETSATNNFKKKIIKLDKDIVKQKSIKLSILYILILICVLAIGFFVYNNIFSEFDSKIDANHKDLEIPITSDSTFELNRIREIEIDTTLKEKIADKVNLDASNINKEKQEKINKSEAERRAASIKKIVYRELGSSMINLRSPKKADSGNGDEKWNEINTLVDNAEYQKALIALNEISKTNPIFIDAQLLKARCFIKVNEFQSATKIYNKLIAEGDEFLGDIYQYEKFLSLVCQLPNSKSQIIEMLAQFNENSNFTFSREVENIKLELKKMNFNFE